MGQSKEYTLQEELSSKWVDKSITPQQEQQFTNWYNSEQDQPLIISTAFARDYDLHKNRIYAKVIEEIGIEEPPKYKFWWRSMAAAAAIIIATVAIYFYIQENRHYDLNELANGFHAGSSVAVLINENGKEQLLKDSIFYAEINGNRNSVSTGTRKIVTPKGGHYKIVLEDGTKVWVNADTKLVYPAAFGKSERTVKLYGEAYFEVASNPKKPFRIQVATRHNQQDITVLGTKFNVSGYDDDTEIRTIVYEGSVKVSSGKSQIILKKGDMLSNKNGKLLTMLDLEKNLVMHTDHVDDIVFDGDFFAAMRKVSRLYNVNIVYDGIFKNRSEFHGSIRRNEKLENVLEIMEIKGQYHFSIDKNKVTVTPNVDYYE